MRRKTGKGDVSRMKVQRTGIALLLVFAVGTVAWAQAPVTLTLLTHYNVGNPHGAALAEYIAEYEQLNPHVKIDYQFITNDMILERLMVGAAAGTIPDMAHIAGYMLGDLAEAGVIAPMPDGVMEQIGDAYVPGALQLTEYAGRHWGYPTEYMPRALVYNQNLFDRVGLPSQSPATWEDLREYAARLTDTNPDGTSTMGFGVGLSSAGQMGFGMLFSLAYPSGGRFLSEDGKQAAFNSPAVSEALGFLGEMVSAGYADAREWLILQMRAASLAMMIAPGPYWKTEFMAVGPEFYAGMRSGPVPVAEAGLTPAAAAYGWLFAVTEASPNKDEVYAFLNWLNTDVLPDGTTRMGNVLAHLGSIPVTVDDLRTQEIVTDPFMAGFVQAVANNWTFADPVAPGALDMYKAIEQAIRDVVVEGNSPNNALIAAEQRVQALLDAVYR